MLTTKKLKSQTRKNSLPGAVTIQRAKEGIKPQRKIVKI
jgi:hypothetical protein